MVSSVLALTAALALGAASADDAAAAKARAKAALASATAAFEGGRFGAAARGYLEAYAALEAGGLPAQPGLLYNAGLAYERLGDCDRVADLFGRFLALDPEHATPELKRRLGAAERCAPKVALTSTPAGAEVRIDGVVRGRTPLTVHLRPGSYTVTVTKAGFRSQRRAVTHAAAAPLAAEFTLAPSEARGRLALEIDFTAAVRLDGEPLAAAPYRGVRDVAVGKHEVEIVAEGCAPRRFTLEVPEGPAPFRFAPEPACAAPTARLEPGPALVTPAPAPRGDARPWIAGGAGVVALVAGGALTGLHVDAARRRDRLDEDPTVTQSDRIRAADDEAFGYSVGAAAAYAAAGVGVGLALWWWLEDDDPVTDAAVRPSPSGVTVRF